LVKIIKNWGVRLKVDELRKVFLNFFETRNHRVIPPASLVPHGDPTLLFTTAGMVQFKPYFMGLESPPASRLTSIQRCFRTTDVEEVGDENHLTLFEMLGNFSVGDYFKSESIDWAWEFLTEVLGIDKNRLWATVYVDDDEAYDLWKKKGIPEEKILRYTAEQGNYWGPPGDSGPCGPCSELHYDFGTPVIEDSNYDPDKDHPALDTGRFLEIWNLVFMAYYQHEDGTREDLPAANIDTGAGLERLAAVLQGVRSAYETDELRSILKSAEKVTGVHYSPDSGDQSANGLRVITEHARAFAYLVADGVLPSNEGRGYVLRRLIRRAVYFGYQMGITKPFFGDVVGSAISVSSANHPELEKQREFLLRVATAEESRFQQTLSVGLELLNDVMKTHSAQKEIPGREMFILYDTHGLPPELTREVAQINNFSIDEKGFANEMDAQRERSKGEENFAENESDRQARYASLGLKSKFTGYEKIIDQSNVLILMHDEMIVQELNTGDRAEIILESTSFYPEGGGQIGDHGEIITTTGKFSVEDTQKFGDAIVHFGQMLEGNIATGNDVETRVNSEFRLGAMRNHTATHLLHSALRKELGTHVKQAGSYVGPDRLRFDYTHPEAPTHENLQSIQALVNEKVRDDIVGSTFVLPYDEAIERGAVAFFEDKYQDQVRVVEYCVTPHSHSTEAGCFSSEFCGGTHIHSTGQIGRMQIVSESSIGAGLRRIEAVTGPEAEALITNRMNTLDLLVQKFKVPIEDLPQRINSLEDQLNTERKRVEETLTTIAKIHADELVKSTTQSDSTSIIVEFLDSGSVETSRLIVDRIRSQLDNVFVCIATEVDSKPFLMTASSKTAIENGLKADVLVRFAANICGGSGGGRAEFAQAGGKELSQIQEALDSLRKECYRILSDKATSSFESS
tara:strand:- start:6400 stop:9132 length:2733 start_codon:yes stop_codon:yes gene_type:complete